MIYRRDYGKLRLWRSCKTSFRRGDQGSKNPAPLGPGSSKRHIDHSLGLVYYFFL
ncbi:MAG: hypothetical protein GF311_22635 [Candidatus Lokiarchaeota archaeon]|nr:hypothetical protein [Candidatus Lokiarchaeota archaeon]